MRKLLFILFVILASCSPLTRTQRMERKMFDPQRNKRESVQHNKLTPEQQAEVKANGGFNPYYASPNNMKVKMPKKPKHLR